MSINDLIFINKLDEGSFTKVYLVSLKDKLTQYAAKKIDKSKYKQFKKLIGEIDILKDLNHPNIIKLIKTIETPKEIYIITELCNGRNLFFILKKYYQKNHRGFTEETVQHITRQLFEGMKYVHNKKIIHRSLNLRNILIHYDDENDIINNNIIKGKIKIADFSLSRYLKKGELANSVLGVPNNISPIIFNKLKKVPSYKDVGYDEKEDIWALGTIFYELLTGNNPFQSQSINELFDKVNEGNYFVPISLSKEAISLLNCMLQYESKNRLSLDKLINHRFLKKNINEFKKIDIEEIKDKINVKDYLIQFNTKKNDEIWKIFGDGIDEID